MRSTASRSTLQTREPPRTSHGAPSLICRRHGSWRWTDSRHKRPMSSIVLDPGVKEMLLDDTRDFLRSEKWYADRGIPFRRGYLLHGVSRMLAHCPKLRC